MLAEAQARANDVSLPSLQSGASGEAVRLLQKLLISSGFNTRFDAQFGPNTKQAVIAFQAANALTNDGQVGQRTWRALTNAIQTPGN